MPLPLLLDPDRIIGISQLMNTHTKNKDQVALKEGKCATCLI
jgi:hypothetical protein